MERKIYAPVNFTSHHITTSTSTSTSTVGPNEVHTVEIHVLVQLSTYMLHIVQIVHTVSCQSVHSVHVTSLKVKQSVWSQPHTSIALGVRRAIQTTR